MSFLDFILSYIIFFFFLLTAITCQETCPSIQCDVDQPKVSFPFGIKDRQGEECAYPGFNLACGILKITILELPSTVGKFYVRDINYSTKEIRLYDQLKCLPRRYLESGETNISPFRGFATHTYRFYDCPYSIQNNSTASETLALYAFHATCIGSIRPLIITPYSSSDPTQVRVNQFLIDYPCLLKASVAIPIPSSSAVSIYSHNVATEDLYLTWTDPQKRSTDNGNMSNNGTGNGNSRSGTPGTQVNNEKDEMNQAGKEEGKEKGKKNATVMAISITFAGIIFVIIITLAVYFKYGMRPALKTAACFGRLWCCPGVCC